MFFRKRADNVQSKDIVKITALLVHAANIDQSFSFEEEVIIKKTLIEIGINEMDSDKILEQAKQIEANSVQILEFTKKVKEVDDSIKIKIIEALWRIVYSNKKADIYETSLMRRLEGLLYIDSKIMGSIKEKIRKENL